MPQDLMNYNDMVQDALRGVVRLALEKIIDEGLPGEHHFYIAFHTGADGVEIPAHLTEQYPDEMTIVMQHQFWDLHIGDDHFSLKLNFSQVPASLKIPYAALTGFFDPSVQFGLQFQSPKGAQDARPERSRAPVDMAPTNDVAAEDAPAEKAPDAETAADAEVEKEETKSADIVSLDTFRKK